MPVITITMGPATDEARTQLITRLTETAVRVTDIPAEKFVVFIDEKSFENIGVAGQQLSQMMG